MLALCLIVYNLRSCFKTVPNDLVFISSVSCLVKKENITYSQCAGINTTNTNNSS